MRTKQARYDELDAENQDYDHHRDYYDRDADGRGGGGGWKVSHVEDDEDIQKIVRMSLELRMVVSIEEGLLRAE